MQDQSATIPKRSKARTVTINLGAYALALAIIWFLARNLSLGRLAQSLVNAQLILFIPAAVASMLFWFLGDTLSYARLFSYLHLPTRFREMLPGTAAYEFLQIVNGLLAGVSPQEEAWDFSALSTYRYWRPYCCLPRSQRLSSCWESPGTIRRLFLRSPSRSSLF
jgi:hypothetical protein